MSLGRFLLEPNELPFYAQFLSFTSDISIRGRRIVNFFFKCRPIWSRQNDHVMSADLGLFPFSGEGERGWNLHLINRKGSWTDVVYIRSHHAESFFFSTLQS